MVRLQTVMMVAATLLVTTSGCVTSQSRKAEKLNTMIKDALPASLSAAVPHAPPATQFATAWQTKLGQLPDPTRNGAMNDGIVGQIFLYTDKLNPAEITGSLTIVANDATTRPAGMPVPMPNIWHFDTETLKKMVIHDDRFGKSLAIFLPWPEEWHDVNRLLIQARYDQPNSYPLFAPQSTVTLDFMTNGSSQIQHSQARMTASQMSVPDPKLLLQQAQATSTRPMPTPPNSTMPGGIPSPSLIQAQFQPQAPTAPTGPVMTSPPVQQQGPPRPQTVEAPANRTATPDNSGFWPNGQNPASQINQPTSPPDQREFPRTVIQRK